MCWCGAGEEVVRSIPLTYEYKGEEEELSPTRKIMLLMTELLIAAVIGSQGEARYRGMSKARTTHSDLV